MLSKETKLFDPRDGFAPLTDPLTVTDGTLAYRDNRWYLYAAGKVEDQPGIHLFSATLPPGAPLAATGWTLTADPRNPTKIQLLAGYQDSRAWDFRGGRHCPCYVKGYDPHRQAWVERIYYAGSAENFWGPYTIGFLEWDGASWIDQPQPVFTAGEPWEHGSVYEPNLVYADGKWKMWYVSGSNFENYIVQGFAESDDGRTNWTGRKIFIPAEEKVFDFHVFPGPQGYEAVFSRIVLTAGRPKDDAGLWWCAAEIPSDNFAQWSLPVRIMTAADRGWHSGPWKPSANYSDADPTRLFVFFDGMYRTADPGPFPYAFTQGCLELDRPETAC